MAVEEREKVPLTKLYEPVLPYYTSVYITVLNIIQCIALAFLINEIREAIVKDDLILPQLLRSFVALGIILLVWHSYVSELQYLWPITLADTFGPFSLGIIESMIVFSTNPKTASLEWFVGCIAILQYLVSFGFWNAYFNRNRKITDNLYNNFYAEYPKFALHLTNFLKKRDRGGAVSYAIFSILSFCFALVILVFPFDWYEIFFPIIYIIEMIHGEYVGNFQKNLLNDKSVGPYFLERRKLWLPEEI